MPGAGTDEPVAMIDAAGAATFFHTDRQGTVIAMADSSGAIAEGPYTYDAYGRSAVTTGVPFRYTGRRLDPETGLYYYRARYYSPSLGRFLQTDPVGYGEGMNLYTYVSNDLLNRTDPTRRYECDGHTVCKYVRKGRQEGVAEDMEAAAGRLTSAAEEISQHLKGNNGLLQPENLSEDTRATLSDFRGWFGDHGDVPGAMRTTAERLMKAAAGLRSNRAMKIDPPVGEDSSKAVVDFKAGQPFGSVPGSGFIYINRNFAFESATSRQIKWALGHDALHAEASLFDQRLDGDIVYALDRTPPDPRDLAARDPVSALNNPDNLMGFVYGDP